MAHPLGLKERARPAARALALLALLVGLPLALAPAIATSAPPPAVSTLGAPRISSGDDATAQRLEPALRQAVAAATSPDQLLPVIVVSRGALAPGALRVWFQFRHLERRSEMNWS